MRYALGFDGGGTKTDCVLMDETSTVLARTRSGPSNAINVGAEASAAALAEAGLQALRSIQKAPEDIGFVLAGISGAAEPELRFEIQSCLQPTFSKATISVTSDLVLSLGATGESPSVVIIAGTGSAVLGKTSKGFARAGGFGPIIGDPGSANDIGRKAASFCFQKFINSEKFLLTEEILKTFNCKWDQFVDLVREQPTIVFPRIFPIVSRCADAGDSSSQSLLISAAKDLRNQVFVVVEKLNLKDESFFLAKTGGVFEASGLLSAEFDGLIREMAPNVRIGPLPRGVAEAAAEIARQAMCSPFPLEES